MVGMEIQLQFVLEKTINFNLIFGLHLFDFRSRVEENVGRAGGSADDSVASREAEPNQLLEW